MKFTGVGRRTVALVVVGALVVSGAVAVAVAAPRPQGYPVKPLVVVDRGRTSYAPWKILVGQSASGPYMRVHHNGGEGGLGVESRDGLLLGLSGAQVPQSAPAMYGIVDDSVSHVTLEFTDGDTQELRLFRLEDVGFFYGIVGTRRKVSVIALDDAWGERLSTTTCENHTGIGRRSLLGNGCSTPDPEPER